MAKYGKHGCLSHFGKIRHRPARPSSASGRRGRGFESRRLDFLFFPGKSRFSGVFLCPFSGLQERQKARFGILLGYFEQFSFLTVQSVQLKPFISANTFRPFSFNC